MEKLIRKLARSYNWQFIYTRAKELGSIKLFNNETDLTMFQMLFLRWLEVYQVLYSDINNNERYIDKEVIEDDIRTEAYLLYRSKKKNKEDKDKGKKKIDTASSIPSTIFKRTK